MNGQLRQRDVYYRSKDDQWFSDPGMQRLLSDLESAFDKFNAREVALTSKTFLVLTIRSVFDRQASVPGGVAHS